MLVRARRLGAMACSLTMGLLALGATAPASYADQPRKPAETSKHAEHSEGSKHTEQSKRSEVKAPIRTAVHPHRATPAAVEHKGRAVRQRTPHAAKQAVPTVRPAIPASKRSHVTVKLIDVLLPGLLGEGSGSAAQLADTGSAAKRASALIGSRLPSETPVVSTPSVAVPEAAPAPVVVPSVVLRPATGELRPVIPAATLLDVTLVTPGSPQGVLAARKVSTRSLAAQGSSRRASASVHAAQGPTQVIRKELPRVGVWPSGPGALTRTGADLPLSLALGGLLLALAAARGVARMRHPRSDDDGHLTFAAV